MKLESTFSNIYAFSAFQPIFPALVRDLVLKSSNSAVWKKSVQLDEENEVKGESTLAQLHGAFLQTLTSELAGISHAPLVQVVVMPSACSHTLSLFCYRAELSTSAATASRRPSRHQQQPGSSTLPMKNMLLILASWIFHDLCQPGLLLVFHPILLLPSFEWQTVPLANSQAHIGHLYLPSSCCICLKYSPHSLLVKCLLVFKCFPLHETFKKYITPTYIVSLLITLHT